MGGKKAQQIYTEVEKINNYIEGSGTLGEDTLKGDTPHEIKISTNYTRNNTTQDGGENNQGAAALTPEALRREGTDTHLLLNKLRETLDDTSLIMVSLTPGQKQRPIKEETTTIKSLKELLGIVTLDNDKDWVKSLREMLEHLIGKGLGEHLVPLKAKVTSPKITTGQRRKFSSTKILNDESPNRMFEDWDLSPEDLREYSYDSLDFPYANYHEIDSDLLSSDEAYLPKTSRTSTPWKAQTRNIPPLYIPRKEKCLERH